MALDFEIHEKIQKVMDDLKLSDNIKNIIKPFGVFGLDLFHAGTLNTKYGAILGIPVNFTDSVDKLRKNLLIKEEPIDWTRPEAQSFLSATSLSENAQKFAIAREILRIQAEEPYINSITLASVIAVSWTLYNAIVHTLKLRERNMILRRTLYCTFILFGAVLWFGIKDYRSYRLDSENDKVLCNMGTEYIKGGQEFYEKMLIKNISLRSLLGTEGEKLYTVHGNEHTFLRQKHMSISHRKNFFDSHLQNLNYKV